MSFAPLRKTYLRIHPENWLNIHLFCLLSTMIANPTLWHFRFPLHNQNQIRVWNKIIKEGWKKLWPRLNKLYILTYLVVPKTKEQAQILWRLPRILRRLQRTHISRKTHRIAENFTVSAAYSRICRLLSIKNAAYKVWRTRRSLKSELVTNFQMFEYINTTRSYQHAQTVESQHLKMITYDFYKSTINISAYTSLFFSCKVNDDWWTRIGWDLDSL